MRRAASPNSQIAIRNSIRMAGHIRPRLESTICRFPGEHYAILLGKPEINPYHVLDAAVMPPMIGPDGRFNQSATHVQPNAPVIEYFHNVCWVTAGLYPLGLIHMHPGGYDQLSGSVNSAAGDVPALRKILENSSRQGHPLPHVIAPIINLDGPGGDARYTGWIVRLDEPQPISTQIIWEGNEMPASPSGRHDELFARLSDFDRDVGNLRGLSYLTQRQMRQAERLLAKQLTNDLAAGMKPGRGRRERA